MVADVEATSGFGGGALKATSIFLFAISKPFVFCKACDAADSSWYSMYAIPFGLPSLKEKFSKKHLKTRVEPLKIPSYLSYLFLPLSCTPIMKGKGAREITGTWDLSLSQKTLNDTSAVMRRAVAYR